MSGPGARLRRVAEAAASLDTGEHVRMVCWPTRLMSPPADPAASTTGRLRWQDHIKARYSDGALCAVSQ